LFAKNSDRHADECQHWRLFAAAEWPTESRVRCQYLTLPQVRRTHRVLGGQPFWLWGFEQGVNEFGVTIGNEAIWTTAPRQSVGLLGMDLIRLGLERAETAVGALEVMTALLEEHGQGGSPRHNDPNAASYDNSFLIADPQEVWVLETAGREWAARRIEGIYSISNIPSLGTELDRLSEGLRRRPGLNFTRDLADLTNHPQTSGATRCGRSRSLLQERAGQLQVSDMMRFLRDHGEAGAQPGAPHPAAAGEPVICVHPGQGQTAASLVADLRAEGFTAWISLATPCTTAFLPVWLDCELPDLLAWGDASFDPRSTWWRVRRAAEALAQRWESYPEHRAAWDDWEAGLREEEAHLSSESLAVREKWVWDCAAEYLARLKALERSLEIPQC
ncbi:MAG: hypothetical protein FJX77_10430, partial [Armatimonadetes bacterium]|nr:hypothetical protein [Armatimonadota bacterium]